MKRSMQEVVELVIFALIALLVGTGVVWLAGWMLGLVGTVLTWLAGLVWSLLRFLVPIAVVAGAVYLLVKLMNRSAERVAREPKEQPMTPPSPWTMSKEPTGHEAGAASEATSEEPGQDVAEEAQAGPDDDEAHASASFAARDAGPVAQDDEPLEDERRSAGQPPSSGETADETTTESTTDGDVGPDEDEHRT